MRGIGCKGRAKAGKGAQIAFFDWCLAEVSCSQARQSARMQTVTMLPYSPEKSGTALTE